MASIKSMRFHSCHWPDDGRKQKPVHFISLYFIDFISCFQLLSIHMTNAKKKKKIEIVYLHWTNTSFDLLLYVHFGLSNNLFTPIILKSFVCIFKWEYPPPPEKRIYCYGSVSLCVKFTISGFIDNMKIMK